MNHELRIHNLRCNWGLGHLDPHYPGSVASSVGKITEWRPWGKGPSLGVRVTEDPKYHRAGKRIKRAKEFNINRYLVMNSPKSGLTKKELHDKKVQGRGIISMGTSCGDMARHLSTDTSIGTSCGDMARHLSTDTSIGTSCGDMARHLSTDISMGTSCGDMARHLSTDISEIIAISITT
ncbi:hypothetical protein J6590_027728 [Homalodisca vitripennis]|nr:hypothetical protein J6590_027728 [Homalodisca vitripennis]